MGEQPVSSLIEDEFPGEWGDQDAGDGLSEAFVLRATNFVDGGLDYSSGARRFIPQAKVARKRLQRGDLILEAAGGGPRVPVGRVARFDPPDDRLYVVSNFFRTLRPAAGTDSRFTYHLLDHLYRQPKIWEVQQQTTGIINLKVRDYLQIPVLAPPLEEQRRIAEILDTIDETIQATERVIAKLELVLDGVAQNGHLGEPGNGEPAQALGSFSTSRSGNTPSRSVGRYYGGGIPWVKSGEVAGSTVLATNETVSSFAVRDYGLRLVPPGTPLVAMYGATAGKVGWLGVEAVTNQAVLAIESDAGRTDPRWLYWALRTGTRRMLNSIQGSGQPNLNKGIIEGMAFVLPGREDQRATAERLDSAEAAIEVHRRELEKLRRSGKGLAADLLVGRVRTVAA